MERETRARVVLIGLIGLLGGLVAVTDVSTTLKYLWADPTLILAPLDDSWHDRLYSPTYLTKLDGTYFLVDCWHNRVLYNDVLDADIEAWDVLDDDLAGPHSIDSNGRVLMVEDTGRHKVHVYLADHDYPLVQTFEDVGERPHRVVYDEDTDAFFVIGSRSQTMSKFQDDGERVHHVYTRELPFLGQGYTRSFSIIDGKMVFVSGPGKVFVVRYHDDSYEVVESHPVHRRYHDVDVHPDYHAFNDIVRIEDHYYVTITPENKGQPSARDSVDNLLLRCDELHDLSQGSCRDLSELFGLKGFPYYLSQVGETYYIPQVTAYSGVLEARLDSEEGLMPSGVVFDSGPPSRASLWQRHRLPK